METEIDHLVSFILRAVEDTMIELGHDNLEIEEVVSFLEQDFTFSLREEIKVIIDANQP